MSGWDGMKRKIQEECKLMPAYGDPRKERLPAVNRI